MTEPQPIRLMHIIARLNIGGTVTHVVLLMEHFGAPHYQSQLVTGHVGTDEGDMAYYAMSHGIEPLYMPELGRSLNPIKDVLTIIKVYRQIRAFKPDIVHTHTAKAGFVGRVAAWFARVPVIIHTFHGHVFHGYFSPWVTQVFLNLERLTAHMSDTVITLSENLRRELAEDYRVTRKSRITVLPLGLDLDVFLNQARHTGAFRAQFNIPLDAPLIGVVGRLVPVKNHALFLKAALQVRLQIPNVHFVIVGDGELREELETQVRAFGLQDAVTFTGWVQDTPPLYGDLDLVVISSLNEGTPVSLIEALAGRCPLVSTDVGGAADLLEGGRLGDLVPSEDVVALSTAMIQNIQSPPDDAVLQERAHLMRDRYGIDRLVSDLDALYRGLLARKRK